MEAQQLGCFIDSSVALSLSKPFLNTASSGKTVSDEKLKIAVVHAATTT
jgi:hypothetical protein